MTAINASPITKATIRFLITSSGFVKRKSKKPKIGNVQIATRIIMNSDIFQILSTANDPAFKRRVWRLKLKTRTVFESA